MKRKQHYSILYNYIGIQTPNKQAGIANENCESIKAIKVKSTQMHHKRNIISNVYKAFI